MGQAGPAERMSQYEHFHDLEDFRLNNPSFCRTNHGHGGDKVGSVGGEFDWSGRWIGDESYSSAFRSRSSTSIFNSCPMSEGLSATLISILISEECN